MPADIFQKHMRWNICPGCVTYVEVEKITREMEENGYKDSPQCTIEPYYKGKFCPCSRCIVKMMCEDMCEELINWKQWTRDRYKRPNPK
jgi:hypothetical protein